jgi:hypothetical protein
VLNFEHRLRKEAYQLVVRDDISLGRCIFHLFPTCLPLWVRLVVWFPSVVSYLFFICFPLVFHFGSGWSHNFPYLFPIYFRRISYSGSVGRVISLICFVLVFYVFPTCFPLWVILGLVGRIISLIYFPCFFSSLGPVGRIISFIFPSFISDLFFICFPLVSHSGFGWSHNFPHLFPICFLFVCRPPCYVLIQLPNVINTISKRWRNKKAFNTSPGHKFS